MKSSRASPTSEIPDSLRRLSCKRLTEGGVYVILLKPTVAEHRSDSALQSIGIRETGLYVGMTGLPVEHRFENLTKDLRAEVPSPVEREKRIGSAQCCLSPG